MDKIQKVMGKYNSFKTGQLKKAEKEKGRKVVAAHSGSGSSFAHCYGCAMLNQFEFGIVMFVLSQLCRVQT